MGEVETHSRQVPKTVMVPQTTYETKYRTVRVPKMTYEDVEVPYREQVMEVKQQTMQVPRMTEEMQSYTTYANQTIQEPVQVMVPQTQTVNTVQQIQKVVEYARTPVNQYVVPGPSYTMPVQQEMQYQQYQQKPTQVVQQEGLQYQQMPAQQAYSMPTGY